ncbi:MAG: DUF1015 domain-containing protein [Bacteroidia bacterium]|nr:DUF1015 domain-containing protein [Bacteroidia bacterium]
MAELKPFQGWRYNPAKLSPQRQLSPLVDVLSPDQLNDLYRQPYNSIQLSMPLELAEAPFILKNWQQGKFIKQDPLPAFYPCYQKFSLYGREKQFIRKGILALVRLNRKEQNSIVLHEGIIEESLQERIRLLETLRMNVAPTHGLFDGADFELEKMIEPFMEKPLLESIDHQGVVNQFGIIQQATVLKRIQEYFLDKTIYLADGHHRLAASERYAAQHPENPYANYHFMYLTNLRADDLKILPIHRFVKSESLPSPNLIQEKLSKYFHCLPSNQRIPLWEEIRKSPFSFGMLWQHETKIIQLKPEINPQTIPLNLPDAVKELPYTVLHYFLFDRVLGIPYEQQTYCDALEYYKDSSMIVERCENDPDAIGIITNELSIDSVLRVCATGAIMPMKSTYFFPKVNCGFVFASIHESDYNVPHHSWFEVSSQK